MPGYPEDDQGLKRPNAGEIVDFLNAAFATGDVDRISQAIGTAAKIHNISDVAKRARLSRPSVYRAFAGRGTYPNLTTVVRILGAMGLGLKVGRITQRGARSSRLARPALKS
jgi:probable addiction module antidote protein